MGALPFFKWANYVEAGFWLLVAAVFLVYALRPASIHRVRCWPCAVAFAAFGVSDIVESRTGAWYSPWWLLAWKAGCLAVFLILLLVYIRHRRINRDE